MVLSNLSSEISVESNPKIGFYQGFIMQFVNPKAWIMAITGASAFLPQLDNLHLSVFVFAITCISHGWLMVYFASIRATGISDSP